MSRGPMDFFLGFGHGRRGERETQPQPEPEVVDGGGYRTELEPEPGRTEITGVGDDVMMEEIIGVGAGGVGHEEMEVLDEMSLDMEETESGLHTQDGNDYEDEENNHPDGPGPESIPVTVLEDNSEDEEDEEMSHSRAEPQVVDVGKKGEKEKMSDSEITRIATKIAEVLEIREAKKKEKSEQVKKLEENWVTGDVMIVCCPCSIYNKSPEIPTQFRTGTRGMSGMISRKNKKGKMRTLHILDKVCRRHEKTNIHIWCEMKEKKELEKRRVLRKGMKRLGWRLLGQPSK